MASSPQAPHAADRATRRAELVRSATYASIAVAVTLVIAKTWAWRATDSVSVLSSLADSFLDVLASLLTFGAVRFSLSPADLEWVMGRAALECRRDEIVAVEFFAFYGNK